MPTNISINPAPDIPATADCEAILRSLPKWFGVEAALLEYASDTASMPTLLCRVGEDIVGFVTLRQHFEHAFEIHCIAVHAQHRAQGHGAALMQAAEQWAAERGGRLMQVKTIADSHPSLEYVQTRAFYKRIGYWPLEVFPTLWSDRHPCLVLVKPLTPCLP
ncbi:MAG: GNAT family N-acetyltransferase [Burkholderiales bacterium]|nr:GNAT family N-acetyltransferase [Burkholderiales bacterium]